MAGPADSSRDNLAETGGSAITEAELYAQIKAVSELTDTDAHELAAYLFAEYDAQREALVAANYDTLVSQLTGTVSDEILDNAARLAETAADSLLRTMALGDIETMGAAISDGLAAGLNPRDIARTLDMVQGLDVNRAKALLKYRAELEASDMTDAQIAKAEQKEFDRLLRDRRETIAATESRRAVSEGDRLQATKDGLTHKVWDTAGDARVSPACQSNEAAGAIPINDSFPGGASLPPQHPRCRCSVTFVSAGQVGSMNKISAKAAERTAKAKEKA